MKAVAIVLSFIFMSQTVAFALDPVQASANSERAQLEQQRKIDQMSSRYEKLSDAKKVKFLNRQEKRLKKFENTLTKMSDKKFDRIKNRLESLEADVDDVTLSDEENSVLVGNTQSQAPASGKVEFEKAIRTLNKDVLVKKIQHSIAQIEIERDEVLSRIAGIETKKSASRSVASVADVCDYIIPIAAILVFVVLILAIFAPIAVGLALKIVGGGAAALLICFLIGAVGSSSTYEWTGFGRR